MAELVIEGTWEEVIQRHDLRGRRVRVIVVDEGARNGGTEAPPVGENAWVRRVREWAESHAATGHVGDDSRDSIYGGTVDDPR